MTVQPSHSHSVISPEVRRYADRIGYEGPLEVSYACLEGLQSAHLHHVPYENLDILAGVPLSLTIADLYDKIVVRRRGGYCFELNALFGWLLSELGFDIEHHFARFWRDEQNPVPKRRHHVIAARLDGMSYLCDVGVGGIVPLRPVKLVEGLVQEQGEEGYRMDRVPQFGWMLRERKRGEWRDIYSFTEEPQLPIDYITASYWCQHAPDSIFRQQAMVAIRTPEGRKAIAGRELKMFTESGVQVEQLESDAQLREALAVHFGIHMPNPV